MAQKIPEEDKQALIELVEEEILMHQKGELKRLTTNRELAELSGKGYSTISSYLSLLDSSLRDYRTKISMSQNTTELHQKTDLTKIVKEACTKRMIKLHQDPEFARAHRERSSKRMIKLHQDPEFHEMIRETLIKLNQNPEFKKASKERGIKNAEILRKNTYDIENRFYSSSQQEGAVALLLEKYIPGYKTREGQNYQVRNSGINNGGLDFLVGTEFLEWHPIVLHSKRRGDIPKEEKASYEKITRCLYTEDKKQFEKEYKKVLALNYKNSRQTAVDNSDYRGLNVYLATDVRELYDFISKYSDNLPSYNQFKTEFNQNVKYVKDFKVDKSNKTLEEA